jgi:hypothetical protein
MMILFFTIWLFLFFGDLPQTKQGCLARVTLTEFKKIYPGAKGQSPFELITLKIQPGKDGVSLKRVLIGNELYRLDHVILMQKKEYLLQVYRSGNQLNFYLISEHKKEKLLIKKKEETKEKKDRRVIKITFQKGQIRNTFSFLLPSPQKIYPP